MNSVRLGYIIKEYKMGLRKFLVFILVVGLVRTTTAQNKKRNITIAGIVIDSKTLEPIKAAKIYDVNTKLLSTTNKDGYFKTKIAYFKAGEIEFAFSIEKDGYHYFEQKEHWGDLENKINATYYFGLQNKELKTEAFSKLITISGNLSYKSIKENFNTIKKRADFNNKVAVAKKGNDKVFFEIDANFYIINDTGWIKIYAKDDLISINGEQIMPAHKINLFIKRKDIKEMLPTDAKNTAYAIFTK